MHSLHSSPRNLRLILLLVPCSDMLQVTCSFFASTIFLRFSAILLQNHRCHSFHVTNIHYIVTEFTLDTDIWIDQGPVAYPFSYPTTPWTPVKPISTAGIDHKAPNREALCDQMFYRLSTNSHPSGWKEESIVLCHHLCNRKLCLDN
jgi:hypothetical protein